jgi:hypothetical protein
MTSGRGTQSGSPPGPGISRPTDLNVLHWRFKKTGASRGACVDPAWHGLRLYDQFVRTALNSSVHRQTLGAGRTTVNCCQVQKNACKGVLLL